jgi:hypothetical protein
MRAIFETFDADIKWDEKKKQVTATKENKIIVLTINLKIAIIDGKEFTLTTPPQLINGKTMIPLRFVGEALDSDVQWLADTKTVEIKSSDFLANELEVEGTAIKEALTKRFNAIYAKDLETYNYYSVNTDKQIKENEEWFKNYTYIYVMDTYKLLSVEGNNANAEIDLIVKQVETQQGVTFVSSIIKTNFKVTLTKVDSIWKAVRFDALGPMQQLPNPNPEDF